MYVCVPERRSKERAGGVTQGQMVCSGSAESYWIYNVDVSG